MGKKVNKIPKETMIELCEEGLRIVDISNRCNISIGMVRKQLRGYGLWTKEQQLIRDKDAIIEKYSNEIMDEYEAGATGLALSLKYNVSQSRINGVVTGRKRRYERDGNKIVRLKSRVYELPKLADSKSRRLQKELYNICINEPYVIENMKIIPLYIQKETIINILKNKGYKGIARLF